VAAFVLVHGAWHDESCWNDLASLLRARGHEVLAPTLPGHGGDNLGPWSITMERYARAIIEAANKCKQHTICVGHSMAGFVIAMAAEKNPDLFKQLIFLTAFVPKGKGRLLPMIVADPSLRKRVLHSDFDSFGGTNSVRPETAAEFLYTDCTPELQRTATEALIPQPIRPLFSSVAVSDARFGVVPKAFIECRHDQAIPIALQRKMQTYTRFDQVRTLDAAHSPFLSMPEKMADVLEELAGFTPQRSS